ISLHRPIKTILLFISAAVILVLAPIRHKNHPLSEQTYRKNAAIGRTITILISMITVWLLLNNIAAAVTTMIVVTLMAIAIMMIIPKIQKGVE
uniref:accessory gene regulator B family protein n=1 Tax=Evtepia gabavorous TaxID=2211183 RepID=UPI003A92EB3E